MSPGRPTLDGLRWEAADDPAAADIAAVDEGLDAFNRRAADLDAVRRAACFARDEAGRVVAGAVGRTWGTASELQQIWVREDLRGRGIGARLVRSFEDLVRNRGCRLLYLDTFTFQAPDFYRKLGFEVACEFAGFPGGASKFILKKAL